MSRVTHHSICWHLYMGSVSRGLAATRKCSLPHICQPEPRVRRTAATRRRIMEGLGARPVDTLDKRTLRFVGSSDRSNEHLQSYDVDGAPEVHITDLKYIGSYNWTDEWVPTIVVPGARHSRNTC